MTAGSPSDEWVANTLHFELQPIELRHLEHTPLGIFDTPQTIMKTHVARSRGVDRPILVY